MLRVDSQPPVDYHQDRSGRSVSPFYPRVAEKCLHIKKSTSLKLLICMSEVISSGHNIGQVRGREERHVKKVVSVSLSANSINKPVTFLQTLVATIICGDKEHRDRILLDSGSQKSYITKQCVKTCGRMMTFGNAFNKYLTFRTV